MERAEAEAVYEQGREAVVAVLLALSARLAAQDAQIAQLAARVAELERRLNRLRCPECGAVTRAELPAGVPPGAFGPRLQAAVATLAVRNRVSRRDTTELLRELFGARLSAGSVAAVLQRVALALDEPYEDLLGHVRAAPAVNVDGRGGADV